MAGYSDPPNKRKLISCLSRFQKFEQRTDFRRDVSFRPFSLTDVEHLTFVEWAVSRSFAVTQQLQRSRIVVNAPMATSVHAVARLCSSSSFQSNSGMPASRNARVAAMRPI
jgi:hypothetical protein